MTNIRLSIAIANYNHGRFLQQRISSIMSQMSSRDELIIVDDASTDNSCQIIDEFIRHDDRIKLFRNNQNLGVVKSANRAISESRGEYLASFSVDDVILPGFIETTMKVLVENPNIPLCCSEFAFFHDTPQKETADIIYTNHLIKNTKNVQVYSHKKIVDAFRKTTFWIPGHTVIVKRSIVLDHQGLNESLGPFSDFFLLHSIALLYGAAYIPENLSALRLIGESYSNVESRNRKISRKNELNLIDMICNKSSADLRYLFRRSGLINGYLRKRFMDLVLFPKYWDFLISSFIRFIERRTYKIGKRISSMRR